MSDWAETATGVGLAVAVAVLVYVPLRATPELAPVDGQRGGGPG